VGPAPRGPGGAPSLAPSPRCAAPHVAAPRAVSRGGPSPAWWPPSHPGCAASPRHPSRGARRLAPSRASGAARNAAAGSPRASAAFGAARTRSGPDARSAHGAAPRTACAERKLARSSAARHGRAACREAQTRFVPPALPRDVEWRSVLTAGPASEMRVGRAGRRRPGTRPGVPSARCARRRSRGGAQHASHRACRPPLAI